MINGIDVSHWQNRIHWPQVAQDAGKIEFAIAKATEGETFQDFRFVENFDKMKENGIKAGAFNIFRMTSTPDGQAKNIIETIKKVGFDPSKDVLIISTTGGMCTSGSKGPCDDPAKHTNDFRAASLSELLTRLEEAGYGKILFVQTELWDKYFTQDKYNFSEYQLWVSDYAETQEPEIPKDWKDAGKSYDYWHYNCKGKVSGIDGDVCLDQAYSDSNSESIAYQVSQDMW